MSLLKEFFDNVDRLEYLKHQDPNYNVNVENLFRETVPRQDMSNEEFKRYLRGQMVKLESVLPKLRSWSGQFIDSFQDSPNALLIGERALPGVNYAYTVTQLKRYFGLNESERQIRRWIMTERLPRATIGNPLRVHINVFRQMLINKDIVFNENPLGENNLFDF